MNVNEIGFMGPRETIPEKYTEYGFGLGSTWPLCGSIISPSRSIPLTHNHSTHPFEDDNFVYKCIFSQVWSVIIIILLLSDSL